MTTATYLFPTDTHIVLAPAEGPKFKGGQVVVTPGALEIEEASFAQGKLLITGLLIRHFSGDWGDLSEEDTAENNFSLEKGFRIFSAYETPFGKLWIITEYDRSATTVLTPDEY